MNTLLIRYSVTTKDLHKRACVLQCHAAVVTLDERYHLRTESVGIHEPTNLQRSEQTKWDLSDCICKLLLNQLIRC